MLEQTPTAEELIELIGSQKFQLWTELCSMIDSCYDMERIWNMGWKEWKYEFKYRRGGKTLCALYVRENCFGIMIIFGKEERQKFESSQSDYSQTVHRIYQESTTYHDGKWMMFTPEDTDMFEDLKKMFAIKRKPNRK